MFSHQTKASIATLGIGAKSDALVTEFTDADKGARFGHFWLFRRLPAQTCSHPKCPSGTQSFQAQKAV
jgi:hypothetical protein